MSAVALRGSDAKFEVGAVWREFHPYEPHLRFAEELPGASVETPAAARNLARAACRGWRIPRALVPDLVLIASELATNAVTHAPGLSVNVAVLLSAQHVWVVVTDQGPYKPLQIRPVATDDEHGRGLQVIAELAAKWAAEPNDEGTGTRVWACLALPSLQGPSGSA